MNKVRCLSSLSTILLSFLSVATASPTNTISTIPHAPPHDLPAYQPSRHPSSPTQSRAPTTNDPPLIPRTNKISVLPIETLNPEWELDFYEYNLGYLPVSSASLLLQAFYDHIIALATTTSDPLPEHSVIRWGALDLEIMASHGAVAWTSVAAFAAHMSKSARKGYTNSYHCLMTNFAAGVLVSFNLYVGDPNRLAPPVPRFNA